jgi:MFS family permease
MGGEWSLGVALVMEAWPANKRPLLAGLIGAASNVGFMGIAIFGMFRPVTESSWREVLLVGASPAILTFIIRIFVPESEKWHESVKKSGTGKPIKEVFGPQWASRTFLAIGLASVALIGTWGTVQSIPTWVSSATEAKLKAEHTETELATDSMKQTIATASASNKARSQIYSSVGAIVGCLIAPLLGAIFNRRIAYAILCLSSLGFCQWIFRGFTEFDSLFYFVVFMVGLTTASFYGWLPLYLPELFPTRIRATGQGIAFNFGRVLAAAGAVYSGDLVKEMGWAGMGATLSLVYIIGVVLIVFCPETKGRPLPE